MTVFELFLGDIKGFWNGNVLPTVFLVVLKWEKSNLPEEEEDTESRMDWLIFHSLVIFNNILLPCLVVALIDRNCFYNMIAQAPLIEVASSYTYCSEYFLPLSNCVSSSEYKVLTSYAPPFI